MGGPFRFTAVITSRRGRAFVLGAAIASGVVAGIGSRVKPPRATEPTSQLSQRTCVGQDGRIARYSVFIPRGCAAGGTGRWPIVVYLHGTGGIGTDGNRHLREGLAPVVNAQADNFPLLAVFPQAGREWRSGRGDVWEAESALADVERRYPVDRERVYLVGYSMGGFGTWVLAANNPRRWAAVVSVAGADPGVAGRIAGLPVWCFHGADDRVVPPSLTRDAVAAIRAAGGNPYHTEYAGLGHAIGPEVFARGDLWDWLLRHRQTK